MIRAAHLPHSLCGRQAFAQGESGLMYVLGLERMSTICLGTRRFFDVDDIMNECIDRYPETRTGYFDPFRPEYQQLIMMPL
jgi:hypothetical protein